MSLGFRRIFVVGFISALSAAAAHAQVPTIVWLGQEGQTSSNATDALSWSPNQVPTATDRAMLTGGGGFNKVLDIGANNVTWRQIFFNNNGPITINGTGTINLAIPYDEDEGGFGDPLNGVEQWGIFSAGGEAFGGVTVPSVVNPNLVTESYIESNGDHSLTFNGTVKALTIQAYAGTRMTFNNDVTLTGDTNGFSDSRFITGNDTFPTVTFNKRVTLAGREGFGSTGFGIRNNMTVVLGANAVLDSDLDPTGWGELNLYNGSVLKLQGNNRIGTGTDVWSRGANSILTNTLSLNGFSDHVEFLGTAADATMVIDYGTVATTNSLGWDATYQTNGLYDIKNFKVGTDALTLGAPGNGFWFETGDTSAEQAILAKIKIDGYSYAPYNPATLTPYWTVKDPTASRAVEFFNVTAENANFNGINGVDGADLLIWQRRLGRSGQTLAQGDANGDGFVNAADLAIWKAQFGQGAALAATGAVPEPTAALLLAVAGLGCAVSRRRAAR